MLQLSGDSCQPNAREQLELAIGWAAEFATASGAPLRVELHLGCLNASSVCSMFELFDKLEAAHRRGRDVSVVWFDDDASEGSRELALEFAAGYAFPFEIVADGSRMHEPD